MRIPLANMREGDKGKAAKLEVLQLIANTHRACEADMERMVRVSDLTELREIGGQMADRMNAATLALEAYLVVAEVKIESRKASS